MKFIHLSDLHIGKRVNEFSMLDDQAYILSEIISIIDAEHPDAVIIAGDIYDKSVPPAEAVQLCDSFLQNLALREIKTFIISGNHDSPERVSFGARLMDKSGIYIAPVYNGAVTPITLADSYGTVNIYMLPFIKPANVRRFFPDAEIETYTDAVRVAVNAMNPDTSTRNILITHQFVTGAARSESEEISVGGSDNVDAAVFSLFDYVALGHIHKPQSMENDRIRYCGTPLKYSFSEANHEKSVTITELCEKGTLSVRTAALTPHRDLREIKGRYMDISAKSFYEGTKTEDYLHITLTDEEDIPDAIGKLRSIYPNIMKLDYDNTRTRQSLHLSPANETAGKTPLELFCELYEKQNNKPMTEEQRKFSEELIEKISEDLL